MNFIKNSNFKIRQSTAIDNLITGINYLKPIVFGEPLPSVNPNELYHLIIYENKDHSGHFCFLKFYENKWYLFEGIENVNDCFKEKVYNKYLTLKSIRYVKKLANIS